MKVLLLHPEDRLERYAGLRHWGLVIDLARAPFSTYEHWSRMAGCRVISLFDGSTRENDLHSIRELLQCGMGSVVDSQGIDWWDVLSILIVPDLLRILQVARVASELPEGSEFFTTRPNALAKAFQTAAQGSLLNIERKGSAGTRLLRHYRDVARTLDRAQMFQVMQDKFDPEHRMRRRLRGRPMHSTEPVVLLPSAYVNVSKTALAYAKCLPEKSFLLVCARNTARVDELPANVRMISLDPYFRPADPRELEKLQANWQKLKSKLVVSSKVFELADAGGSLQAIPERIPWGWSIREAWAHLLESHQVVGCLSADDSNPYTRIPLMLARSRSIPTVACHHGALDYMMAIKRQAADVYLAKSEMERDYLEKICRVPAETITLGAPNSEGPPPLARDDAEQPWLVFFSEPYKAWDWRTEEIYRELLPRLAALAKTMGLTLLMKLHPFESVQSHHRRLREILGREGDAVKVMAGSLPASEWSRIRVALTVQSSVALDCVSRGIPVFLCSWLQDSYSAYGEQFSHFGAGKVLESVKDLQTIPLLLEQCHVDPKLVSKLCTPTTPEALEKMFSSEERGEKPILEVGSAGISCAGGMTA